MCWWISMFYRSASCWSGIHFLQALAGHAGQQLAYRTVSRDDQFRIELEQRIQDEGAFVEPGVRYGQFRAVDGRIAIQQQIEIQRARPPLDASPLASVPALDVEQMTHERGGILSRAHATNGVDEIRLFPQAHGV